jgi:TatD DNase family protein
LLIDTHAHLYWDSFEKDLAAVIDRAISNDVRQIINIATDLETGRQCISFAEQFDSLFATAGIHPNDAAKFDDTTITALKSALQHPKVVAIGEIGLDFYRDWCPPATQEKVFRKQLRLAVETGFPVIIHNRNAGREIVNVMKSEVGGGLSGVFHCFSEDAGLAQDVLDLGFHISFTGNLTFRKSHLPEVARLVPLHRLLLETDSPFLSPEPKRGRRNEPAHVVYIANKLSEVKEVSFDEIVQATTENATKLFGLGDRDMM